MSESQDMDENMTDYQFETLLKMILEIVKGCETKEEAVNKIQELLNNKKIIINYRVDFIEI